MGKKLILNPYCEKSFASYCLWFKKSKEENLLEAFTYLLPVVEYMFGKQKRFSSSYLIGYHEDDSKQEASIEVFEKLKEKVYQIEITDALEIYSAKNIINIKRCFIVRRRKEIKQRFFDIGIERAKKLYNPAKLTEQKEFLYSLPEKIIKKSYSYLEKRILKENYKEAVRDTINRIIFNKRYNRFIIGNIFDVRYHHRKMIIDLSFLCIRRAIEDIKKTYGTESIFRDVCDENGLVEDYLKWETILDGVYL